ncbi:hypothetical protein GCM10007853_00940 [Algimonas ampicilliniresistens]|uniref:Uncharacterized protein n=1 Tax=Algimonas ampicilliniresistens TaxID=1298735 RepID=A0ABQ5V6C3_9PROT|nr:hypothetical protein GCM10007853_00940 [Algimonas ampicilliniresistens]
MRDPIARPAFTSFSERTKLRSSPFSMPAVATAQPEIMMAEIKSGAKRFVWRSPKGDKERIDSLNIRKV